MPLMAILVPLTHRRFASTVPFGYKWYLLYIQHDTRANETGGEQLVITWWHL